MYSDFQTPSDEAVIRSIANGRRRRVLQHLIDSREEAVPFDELVAAMTDDDATASERGARQAIQLRTELYHVHLPKLAEAGVVEYDERSGVVRYRPDDRVEAVVRLISEGLKAR